MSRAQIKSQIKQLKFQMRAENRVSDIRVLKLAVLMVILALIAAFRYGLIRI